MSLVPPSFHFIPGLELRSSLKLKLSLICAGQQMSNFFTHAFEIYMQVEELYVVVYSILRRR